MSVVVVWTWSMTNECCGSLNLGDDSVVVIWTWLMTSESGCLDLVDDK